MVKEQLQVSNESQNLNQEIVNFKSQFTESQDLIQKVIKDAQRLDLENKKYNQELILLVQKKIIIQNLHKELTFTEQEKQLLFGEEINTDNQNRIKEKDISRFLSMEGIQEDMQSKEVQEEESKFDKFKEDFFKALSKLKKMQDIQSMLQQNDSSQNKQQQKLANSIGESIKFVEDNAYVKLVQHLKAKIRLFNTPLEHHPEFLTFMKVTLSMLRNKSLEMYSHIINDLIIHRSLYINVSFQEKTNQIFSSSKQEPKSYQNGKSKETQNVNSAKNVALQIAWLHEALMNEMQILDHTSIQRERYLDALNTIFTRTLAKQLKQRLESQITSQDDLAQSFELYYLLSSFIQIMQDQFITKTKISQKLDFSDFTILSFLPELKSKSLQKLVETSDNFSSKLSNLFQSQQVSSSLQIERYIQLISRIFQKLFEVITQDPKDIEIFKKRILLYSITRILPSIQTLNTMIQDQTILPQNAVLLLNYFSSLKSAKIIPVEIQKNQLKDEMELIQERYDGIIQSLKQIGHSFIKSKQLYQKMIESEDIYTFKHSLEEFEEDLEYEEVKLQFLYGLSDRDTHQLIVEFIKQEVKKDLQEQLDYVLEERLIAISKDKELTDDQKSIEERKLNYLEFELVEKLEYIKKKIS
eukprot:403366766